MEIKKTTYITNSFEKTKELGKTFSKSLKAGDVVCLYGDLGSGKTTFVQGLAEGLGIENRIISPTFVMVRNYKISEKRKTKNEKYLFHIDLYRMESERDLEGLGIEEIINNKNNIVVIEWAEKLKSFLPKKRIDINFYHEGEGKRKINFTPHPMSRSPERRSTTCS